MAAKEIVKEYAKGALTILWKPAKCIHSEECIHRLPEVYRPAEKPWIRPENASIAALRSQIDHCPSGALSYRENTTGDTSERGGVTAEVVKGGPLLIRGNIALSTAAERKELSGSTAFCRCGASGNKPFCDGSHRKTEFDN